MGVVSKSNRKLRDYIESKFKPNMFFFNPFYTLIFVMRHKT